MPDTWKDKFYRLADTYEEQDVQFIYVLGLLKMTREKAGAKMALAVNPAQLQAMQKTAKSVVNLILTTNMDGSKPEKKEPATEETLLGATLTKAGNGNIDTYKTKAGNFIKLSRAFREQYNIKKVGDEIVLGFDL